ANNAPMTVSVRIIVASCRVVWRASWTTVVFDKGHVFPLAEASSPLLRVPAGGPTRGFSEFHATPDAQHMCCAPGFGVFGNVTDCDASVPGGLF
uniref:hypothetical protein n=1 Tax=Aliiroseovarius sp. TaxID=1872442 RepID=UPI002632B043